MRVRKHRQPFFVDVWPQSAILDPDVDLGDVFGCCPGDLQNLTNAREHLRALGLNAFGIFARVRLLARYAAGDQKRPYAAGRRNGIVVLEPRNFDADASAHMFATLYNSRSMGPLASIRVLDLTRVRSGPTAVRQLADWGADVIKIEQPAQDDVDPFGGGERHSPDFQNLHRNKRSLTLNLKAPEGVAILKRLARDADVMIENYRPDVKRRLGIDYPAMREVNQRLIYASISGFGEDGPYRDRPGFDQIAQGMGGFMSVTGLPGQGPVRAGIPIADLCAGILCAQGVLLALIERQISGQGQWVTTSLLAAQIFMLDFQASRWLNAGEVPKQAGNNHPLYIPTGAFKTADGHINIGASGQKMWERLAPAIGAPELLADPRYTNADKRSENRDALTEEIERLLASADSATWIERLNAAGVPCGRIYSVDQVFADPQVEHLTMVDAIESPFYHPLKVVAQAVRLSRTPHELTRRPPEPGEHTDEILGSLGLAPGEIADLRSREIV
jgi:crotonobetainyl-CoA:carnitine CoA-transferase CaiB-like acyl-CoA transferase